MRLLAVTVSIGAALLVAAAPGYAAGGDAIFKKSCTGCHYTDGPAKEKTIADQLAKKGPELWYAGSKFQKPWLAAWLQNPKPIRPLKYNSLTDRNPADHPKLSASDAAAVTDFLMGLKSSEVKAGVIKPAESAQGKNIFAKKAPCGGCHEYPVKGEMHGGKSGPSLAGASKRLNPDWVYAYLANIKAFKPVRDMPDFGSVLNKRDLESIASYVASLE
ncbi:c-type cytochrome [Candidatus Ferrigenium straubiae]|jgi:mono/diheme cytochrome c family protein|uniref:c-type cytochrome n=1 Tax=Candidatus Ferrigenium straubiae TaxID=2919506 RepID=UPI003F4ACAF8